MRAFIASIVPVLIVVAASPPAQAGDWGYGESTEPQTPVRPAVKTQAASPRLPGKATNAPGRPGGKAPQPAAKAPASAKSASQEDVAVEAWLSLYALAARQELDNQTKVRCRQFLSNKIASGNRSDVMSIMSFWPQAQKAMSAGGEQKENYRDLFRALLRLRARNLPGPALELAATALSLNPQGEKPRAKEEEADPTLAAEAEVLACVLGPLRVAVPGSPPLSEDAVDAYADMACFLYEQKHPGRTIDGNDNRIIFVKVVCDKYKEAPSERDRQAMVNFDITWAKFKILWTASDEKRRQLLIARFGGGEASLVLTDPALDAVLKCAVWTRPAAAKS